MKKGASAHLEMILAFTIFILAVVFLLVFIRPLETNKLSDVAVISLKDSFVGITQTELITVYVNGSADIRCYPSSVSKLNWTYTNTTKETDYFVYFSNEFLTSGSECTPRDINIGGINKKNPLSNRSIMEMQTKYFENYSGLKEDLNLPVVLEFEIYTEDFKVNMTRGYNSEMDIVAKRYVLSVLNSDGNLTNKNFIFRAW